MNRKDHPVDLSAIRARLQASQGPRFWRSLEEVADTPEFREYLHREFPRGAAEWDETSDRRRFLKLMGASLALAGLTACTKQPRETIVPYVRAPEEIIPGKPLYFATAMPVGGGALGLLVESHMGRPTKIEGNPDHPASLGSTDAQAQAAVLDLYDPDRSQTVTRLGEISSWGTFLAEVREVLESQRTKRGAGVRILTEGVTSPTLAHQLRSILADYPEAGWHQYDPINRDHVRAGALMVFGTAVQPVYRFDQSSVVLSLDADFLSQGPGRIRYTRDFSARRRVREGRTEMARLYVVESSPSNTGAMADHRLPLRASEIERFVQALAAELGVAGGSNPSTDPRWSNWIGPVARDLRQRAGAGIVLAGDNQSPRVHALCHAINQALGNAGKTVVYTDPVEFESVDQLNSLRQLSSDIDSGTVELLLILGGNPAYNAPPDLRFPERLSKVKLRVHLSSHQDETSELCHWHIPQAHFLESWSDVRAFDGTVSLIQPLIAPLYAGKSIHEVLAIFTQNPNRSGYDLVRDYWRTQRSASDFESFWRTSLHDGVVAGTTFSNRSVVAGALPSVEVTPVQGVEVTLHPDPHVYDGRFANNSWLQELPKPMTHLTWDNAVLVSPAMAEQLGLSNGDVVELKVSESLATGPVWILPGQPADSIAVHLGYGRRRAGEVGTGVGFDAYALSHSNHFWSRSGVELRKLGRRMTLACTQHHHSMEGRNPVRAGTLEQYLQHPEFVHEMGEVPVGTSLYPEQTYTGDQWGMVIDLNACTGCNACTIACQSENNIPVVGKDQVANGREMHWIRVDRYFEGGLDNPATYHQPVPCMQCEDAPCEVVCPVAATVHSPDGLNDMAYNRCVGTRYCSNNCPYKVRRFNYLLYADWDTPSLQLGRNPDVTVRSRGVMEKCTYCVQRINAVRIEAKREDRSIQDGEIQTACEQACPAQAIVFGNINDPKSRISGLRGLKLNYGLLAELNTRPRTTYLATLRNPNPEMKST
ncbi:MAG: TAT-variant-translocated molybdopterin oxidoreductase [Acidobacteriota bacterium]